MAKPASISVHVHLLSGKTVSLNVEADASVARTPTLNPKP